MSRSIKTLAGLTSAVLVLAVSPQQAEAALVLELESGASSVSVIDNGVGDLDLTVGSVTFNGSVGDFDVNVSTGTSKPVIGSASNPRLSLNSVNVSSASTGSIEIRVTDTDFSGPVGPGVPTLLDFGGTTNGSVGIDAFVDTSNTEFGTATSAGSIAPIATTPFDDTDSELVSLTAPFSATLVAVVTHDNAGDVTSFNGQLYVPEPGSLALIAIGAGMVAYRRRRHG